jgi:hypothetical protein
MAGRNKIRRAVAQALSDLSQGFVGQHGQQIPGTIKASGGTFTIEASDSSRKRFTMLAYSGGPLTLREYDAPVVVDLQGVTIEAGGRIPVPFNHNLADQIGETDSAKITAAGIEATGYIDSATENGKLVTAAGKGGLDWEASIGAPVQAMEFYRPGEHVTVNGRSFSGPVYVARKTALKEISIVRRGADVGQTRVAIAASLTNEGQMNEFETWLKASGFDPATMPETQKAGLKTLYDRTTAAPPPVQASVTHSNDLKTLGKQMLAAFQIQAALEGHPEIAKEAITADGEIAAGWDLARVKREIAREEELKTLRASRASGPFIAAGIDTANQGQVLEAAMAISGGLPNVEKHYTPQVIEAAHKQFKGRIGLQEVFMIAAEANGGGRYRTVNKGNVGEILASAFPAVRAAGQSISLPGILSNVANKFLLMGFMGVDQKWRRFAKVGRVSDFKTTTRYRLLDSMVFEKIGPNGKIKLGELSEESFTNKVDTYAKMFAVDRPTIINDDLGAMTDVPQRLGRGAGVALQRTFWAEFMDNSTFFADPSAHYLKGSTTNLSSAGLAAALKKWRDKVDNDSNPLGYEPKILLVGATNEVTAKELLASTNYNTGGSSSNDKVPNKNIWAGAYDLVVSEFLENTNYTGNSTTAYYLFCDPMECATIEVVFLDGVETPTIEQSESEFDTLGAQFRGYLDFGVNLQDARGGLKVKGAA